MNEGYRNNQPVYCPVNCRNEKDCSYAKDGRCCAENAPVECEEFKWFFPTWEDWDRA